MKKKLIRVCISLSLALISASLQSNSDKEIKKGELAHQLNSLRVEALTELDTQHYAKAEQLFGEILKLEPKTWLDEAEYNEILLFLAQTELFLGKFEQAKWRFEQLLKEGMTKGVLYKKEIIKAQILDREGQKQLALKTLNDLKAGLEINLWEIKDQRYYLQLKSQIDYQIEERFNQAMSCFENQHYSEALLLFEEVLNALELGVYIPNGQSQWDYQLRLKVASCCFQQGQYKKAQKLLHEAKELSPAIFDADSFYRLIMTTKELGELLKGVQYCKEFLSCGFAKNIQQAIKLEMGRFYFLLGEKSKAKEVFESLLNEIKEPSLLALLKLSLTKIAFDDKEFEKVIHLLDEPFCDNDNSSVRLEKNCFKGAAYYHLGKYKLAKESLKELMGLHPDLMTIKEQQGLYFLGNSCLKLAQMSLSSDRLNKEKELKEAREVFEKLHQQALSDQTILALGRTLLLSRQLLNETQSPSSFEQLVTNFTFHSLEGELEMGLIQAEWEVDSSKKAQIYQKLTAHKYENCKNFGKAWYNQAAFYAQSPSCMSKEQAKQKALESFIQSYHYFKLSFPKKACLAIKNWISLQTNGQNEMLLKAYHNLESLIEQEKELLNKNDHLNGLRYLQAELCLKLLEINGDEIYFKKGVEGLELCAKEEKVFSAQKLFGLANLYKQNQHFSKAKNYFLMLSKHYPHFEKMGEVLFKLAECAQKENADSSEVKGYLKKLYENYPDSPLASNAYLTFYSDEDYLSGSNEPLEHLKGMHERFKDSPQTIKGYYLLGLAYKNKASIAAKKTQQLEFYNQSLDWLNRAKIATLKASEIPSIEAKEKESLSTLYDQSILLLGQVYLESANLHKENQRLIQIEKAIVHLQSVILKLQGHADVKLKEIAQAKLSLGLAYGQKGVLALSEKTFKELIENYRDLQIFKDPILERAFYELSQIAIAKKSLKEALAYLEQAELASMSQNQNEELALQQSYCYRLLGQYEQAEIYLSKVINSGKTSKLQAKAMYLRAEIYKLQGKKDLAMKQFEMIASQNNEWARLAQAKLVQDYHRN